MIIKLKIQSYQDRKDMVYALTSNEYKTWIEETKTSSYDTYYYVCFEVCDKDVISNNGKTNIYEVLD